MLNDISERFAMGQQTQEDVKTVEGVLLYHLQQGKSLDSFPLLTMVRSILESSPRWKTADDLNKILAEGIRELKGV